MVDQDRSAPQWARDPTGRYDYRYWDGAAWTGHVVNGLLPTAPPTPRASADPSPNVETSGAITTGPRDTETTGEIGRTRAARSASQGLPDREPLASTLSRRAFWMGALAGGVVVLAAAFAVGAWRESSRPSSSSRKVATQQSSDAGAPTTTTVSPGRPPQEVKIMIVNSSGVSGAATAKSEALTALGYQNAGLTNGTTQRTRHRGAMPEGIRARGRHAGQERGNGDPVGAVPRQPASGCRQRRLPGRPRQVGPPAEVTRRTARSSS